MQRNIGYVVETKLGKFCLPPKDVVGNTILVKFPDSLMHEIQRVTRLMPRFGRVLVVGAHIGTIAVPLSAYCEELTAVEPNPTAFEMLEINAAINGRTNMLLCKCAARETAGNVPFRVRLTNSGASGVLPVRDDPEWAADAVETIEVYGGPLDGVLAGQEYDLVFMDCEGSETFALRGMQRILGSARTLIVEFIGRHLTDVAGVSVAEFLAPIAPHFSTLFVPSTGVSGGRESFERILTDMAVAGKDDAGIVFLRA